MPHIVTIKCAGEMPAGCVPCISGPLPELGNGKPEDALTLVSISPRQWALHSTPVSRHA